MRDQHYFTYFSESPYIDRTTEYVIRNPFPENAHNGGPCYTISLHVIRNPYPDDTRNGAPWCYTEQADISWKFCDIPYCGNCSLVNRIL